MTREPVPRVSPIHPPESYELPSRNEAGGGDAQRQAQFMLGEDLALFAEAMNLQLSLAREAYPSKYRTHPLAAITALWSRSYAYLSDALLLVARGSYPTTLPILRTACEIIAAQEGLRSAEMIEHTHWLEAALVPDETFKAFDYNLGLYFAGGVIARDESLGRIYRPAADLARPAFGATLLQVAPDSNNNRLAIGFADGSFHLGWAELLLGWLLSLASRQLRVIIDAADMAPPIFPASEEARAAYDALQRRIDAALARNDRCSLSEVDDHGDRRYLIANFRRNVTAAPRKVIL